MKVNRQWADPHMPRRGPVRSFKVRVTAEGDGSASAEFTIDGQPGRLGAEVGEIVRDWALNGPGSLEKTGVLTIGITSSPT